MKILVSLLSTFLIAGNLQAQDVELHRGCDCPTVELDNAYCVSTAVFTATALNNDTVYAPGGMDPVARDVVAFTATRFLVNTVIKGALDKEVVVISSTDQDDCGYHFLTGEDYMVFATIEEGNLRTDRCDATRPLTAVTQGFTDSLEYVRKGNGWNNGAPLKEPCN